MHKQFLIVSACLAVAVFSSTCKLWPVNIIAVSNAAELGYAPQINNDRQVKITATLQKIPKDAKTWEFELSLETHTHALSEGLEDSSVLIAAGKRYQPLGWEGSPPGGHHRKGILHFQAITPNPVSVELQIRLIGDPAPRVFKWQLK